MVFEHVIVQWESKQNNRRPMADCLTAEETNEKLGSQEVKQPRSGNHWMDQWESR